MFHALLESILTHPLTMQRTQLWGAAVSISFPSIAWATAHDPPYSSTALFWHTAREQRARVSVQPLWHHLCSCC